jgi:hypothetical protein
MSAHPLPASRGLRAAQPTRLQLTDVRTIPMRSMAVSLQLLHEALSRVRMRQPQAVRHSEASSSARQIAMRARREQERQLSRH